MKDLDLSYWPATGEISLVPSNCGDVLRQQAARSPENIALKSAESDPAYRRTWTYLQLLNDAEATARFLVAHYPAGSRFAVMGGNQPEWVILQFALALAKMVLVTVNPAYRAFELAYVLRQSGSLGVFYQRQYRGTKLLAVIKEASVLENNRVELTVCFDELAQLKAQSESIDLPALESTDPVMIQYTSGTTGAPKGAVLSNHGITNNSRMMALIKGLDSNTINLGSPPLYHTGGCVGGVLSSVQTGGTFLLPESFDAETVLDLIEEESVTYAFAVPTMLVAMLESQQRRPRNLDTLKTVFTGGTIVPVEIVKRTESEFGVDLVIGYGMTETSPAITHTRLTDGPEQKSETVGFPIPQIEVKIIDVESGAIMPIGREGELCTRGFHLMLGYHDMPEATAETIDAQGWLHTGDLCIMDSRGYCRVSGRLKDMIIRGGENIYPREIEEVLYTCGGIREASVVGIPDDYWGEQVGCVVVLDPKSTLDINDLKQFVEARLARHKLPKFWFTTTQLPMTVSGKVQKFQLQAQIADGQLNRLDV